MKTMPYSSDPLMGLPSNQTPDQRSTLIIYSTSNSLGGSLERFFCVENKEF